MTDIRAANKAKKAAQAISRCSSYQVKILTIKHFHKFVIGKSGANIWIGDETDTMTGPSDSNIIKIISEEIKIPTQSPIETKGDDLKIELSVDAFTNPANGSMERMLLEKEATVTEETNRGLYETKTRTKYTTQKSNVFMKKDIKR